MLLFKFTFLLDIHIQKINFKKCNIGRESSNIILHETYTCNTQHTHL